MSINIAEMPEIKQTKLETIFTGKEFTGLKIFFEVNDEEHYKEDVLFDIANRIYEQTDEEDFEIEQVCQEYEWFVKFTIKLPDGSKRDVNIDYSFIIA